MTVNQISVFVENKPGKLVEVIETLGDNGVDLRAMSIADTSDFGILRLIVDKPDTALEVLNKDEYITSVNKVIAVSIEDTPGSLARVLRILAEAGVSIEYVYAFITHEAGSAYVIIRVEDNERAVAAMKEKGVKLATNSDLFGTNV